MLKKILLQKFKNLNGILKSFKNKPKNIKRKRIEFVEENSSDDELSFSEIEKK